MHLEKPQNCRVSTDTTQPEKLAGTQELLVPLLAAISEAANARQLGCEVNCLFLILAQFDI